MACVVAELKVLWVGLEVEGFWRIEEYEVRERLNLEVWWARGRAVMIVAMQGCLVQTHRTRIEISKSPGGFKLKLHAIGFRQFYGSAKAQKLAVWRLAIVCTFMRVFGVDDVICGFEETRRSLYSCKQPRVAPSNQKQHYRSFRWPDEGMMLKLRYILMMMQILIWTSSFD